MAALRDTVVMRLNVYLPVRIKVGEVFKDVFPCAAISCGEQSGYILHDEKTGAKRLHDVAESDVGGRGKPLPFGRRCLPSGRANERNVLTGRAAKNENKVDITDKIERVFILIKRS